jgi:hypothetical protein
VSDPTAQLADALKREIKRRALLAPEPFDLEDACSIDGRRHVEQLALARDPSKRIAACCGRRAGKSTGIIARALHVCTTTPNANVYYCTKSFQWAADTIVEPILRPMLAKAGIFAEEEADTLTFVFANGSRLHFLAADDLGDIKKFNGKKMHLCIVDEMQDLREEVLVEFLTVVVKYCLYDYDGTLILAGIPAESPVGFWFRTWSNPSYSKHTFTAYDNPLRTPEETDAWVQAECAEHGITIEHPLIQRSIFAQWVPMTDWLAYKYSVALNGSDCRFFRAVTKDTYGWRFAVGVDTGSMDRTAIVVIGQSRHDKATHLVDEWIAPHGADLDFSSMVKALLDVRAKYRPDSWYFDPAHAGKPLMAELTKRHGFPLLQSAKKSEMKGQVELVNDGLRTGKIKIPPESEVAADMLKTTWDRDLADKNRWEFSTTYHPDPSEAFRYAYQGVYSTWFAPPDLRHHRVKELEEEMNRIDERSRSREWQSDDDAPGESFMPANPYGGR